MIAVDMIRDTLDEPLLVQEVERLAIGNLSCENVAPPPTLPRNMWPKI